MNLVIAINYRPFYKQTYFLTMASLARTGLSLDRLVACWMAVAWFSVNETPFEVSRTLEEKSTIWKDERRQIVEFNLRFTAKRNMKLKIRMTVLKSLYFMNVN